MSINKKNSLSQSWPNHFCVDKQNAALMRFRFDHRTLIKTSGVSVETGNQIKINHTRLTPLTTHTQCLLKVRYLLRFRQFTRSWRCWTAVKKFDVFTYSFLEIRSLHYVFKITPNFLSASIRPALVCLSPSRLSMPCSDILTLDSHEGAFIFHL